MMVHRCLLCRTAKPASSLHKMVQRHWFELFGPCPSHCVLIAHHSIHIRAFPNQGSIWYLWPVMFTNQQIANSIFLTLLLWSYAQLGRSISLWMGSQKTWVNLNKFPGTRPKRTRDGPPSNEVRLRKGPLSNANLCPKTSCQNMIGPSYPHK